MRNNIVLFSHNVHSFMFSEIKRTTQLYDKVVLLCPFNIELKKFSDEIKNIEYYYLPKIKFKNIYYLPCFFSNKLFREDFFKVIKSNKLNFTYLKSMIIYMHSEKQVLKLLKNLNIEDGTNWIAISFWFYSTSYAVCRAKEKYKNLYCVSLAHSFEIDPQKNNFIEYFYKNYCHKYLDKISFISENVKNEYVANYVIPNCWNRENICVDYLGVEKHNEGLSLLNRNQPYKILSCSHCVPVKRIDLIIEALSLISDIELTWVHIGDGTELVSLKKKAKNINNNIKIEWLGNIPNESVQRYLVNNTIDLFINVSSSEGLPVTLMEAISYGIPIIATDVGGNNEIASNQIGVLLSPNPTALEIANSIKMILLDNITNRKIKRNNAYKLYTEKFFAKKLRLEFYQNLKQY